MNVNPRLLALFGPYSHTHSVAAAAVLANFTLGELRSGAGEQDPPTDISDKLSEPNGHSLLVSLSK